ncbi:cyclic AMP-dependent transcription factor ATF-2 [Onthophagus taurus]|uniref:cyclic AMP-dependent transcription factor ATF-2 n=1 Tax=Onthophagus taurus TaxID=166361 RepID=UPI000C202662|nr:uncharacterized protein LOC111423874 [Onthophagus taurus]
MQFTMGDSDKPFVCTNKDCNMSFSNEDHLSVHSKKHDMVLNLGLSKTPTIADQTPTPTRFIRNCEEVGLFQDLQNVNPFDETFRKAIENTKNGMTHVIESTSEDSLHTPQIFETSQKLVPQKYEQPDIPEDFSLHSVIPIHEGIKTDNELDDIYEGEDETPNFRSVMFEPETEIDLCSSNSSEAILPEANHSNEEMWNDNSGKNVDFKLELREKLKEALHKRKAEEDPLEISDTDKLYLKMRGPRLELKHKIPYPSISPKKSLEKDNLIDIYDKNVSEVDRRRLMNRMAQMRSRERKKVWLDQMKDEMIKLKGDNKDLIAENKKLKEENAYLKSVLLKHNQCSLNIDVEKETSSQLILNQFNPVKKLKPIKPRPVTLTPLKLNASPRAVVAAIQIPASQQKIKDLPILLPRPTPAVVVTPASVVRKTPVIKHTSVLPPPPVLTSNNPSPSPTISKTLSTIRINGNSSVVIQMKGKT